MCLIALAHLASPRFPFVMAANRDEEYARPTEDAHWWRDAPDVVGGRDALYGGSWLAARNGGRFAAVTNLSGAARRTRSRGFLVRDFVTGERDVRAFADEVARDAEEYAGFHLLAGTAGGAVLHITPEVQRTLGAGIHAFSNAPLSEEWPKTAYAAARLAGALRIADEEALVDELMRFLRTPRGTGDVRSEVFIEGERYGTRSSTVVVATADEMLFVEQNHPRGERRAFRLARGLPPAKA